MKQKLIILTIAMLATTFATAQNADTVQLPYTANFTQGWTATGGATIIDSNHASITSQGQKITSPWIQSEPGKTFFVWGQQREGEVNYESEFFSITIENEYGIIESWNENAGTWGSSRTYFISPGGSIRVSIEYTGSSPVTTLQINEIALYNYQIENSLEGPSIARVGDTVTFTAHATLQNNEMADYYYWFMYVYHSNGSSWVDDNDPSRTIVSHTDSTFVVVWNTPGRYSLSSHAYKFNVYNNYSASADDWLYINIISNSFYEEDSIYYTSAAKDTVIGCHPHLHVANLPESVTVIADSAFFNLANLSHVSMPDGLEHIGKMAFAWNQGMTEITIPQGVQFVGDNAFWWDTNLAVINFNAANCQVMSPTTDNNGNYWPVFIGCDNVTTINIGENVTRIPDRAFSYCNGLRGTLTIPDAVTYIGRSAFYHWKNEWDWDNGSDWDTLAIVLGSSMNEIGDFAFGSPRAHITSVTSHNPVPPTIYEQTFYRYEPEYTPVLFVPCGSAETYHAAQHWSRFQDIREDCNSIEDADILDDIKVYVNGGHIVVVGAEDAIVQMFDMMGRIVPTDVPSSGVYMVKIGLYPARKIVVIK